MITGPYSYENWKAYTQEEDWSIAFEYPLYSDALIIGKDIKEIGPYEIINTVSRNMNRPALILRAHHFLTDDVPSMEESQTDSYHGGVESDEIAALLSLCLGIRLKAGEITRLFKKDGNPMGRPISLESYSTSITSLGHRKHNNAILQSAIGEHHLDKATILSSYPLLNVEDAVALVRASRMYQEGIWIIESAPELSWLMLVSAVEVVANRWNLVSQNSVENMQIAFPDLENTLRKYAGEQGDELVKLVAEQIAIRTKPTNKFVKFIKKFLPSEPSVRPPTAQFEWKLKKIADAMSKIYDYRSRALHDGKPFPAPMCTPPFPMGGTEISPEIFVGLAESQKGAVWKKEDIPMLLHLFEYIVRGTILNWWKSLVVTDTKAN